MNLDNQGIVSGTSLGQRWVLLLEDRAIYFTQTFYKWHGITMGYTPPSKILKLYKNKCLGGSRSLGSGREGYKILGPDGHTSDRRWIFLYKEGDNNYSISMTIFGYNLSQKLLSI